MENEQTQPTAETPAEASALPANISIDLMTEEHLKDAPVSELEGLLTYMHGMANVLRVKQQMVHDVLEAKQTAEAIAAKAAKMSEGERAAMLAELSKPPTQHLIGDHITKDNDGVNPGGA